MSAISIESILSKIHPCYTGIFSHTMHFFSKIDSTNSYAKKQAEQNAPHASVYIAEEQTHGRGRHGKQFFSPANTGIYLSVLYRKQCENPFFSTIGLCTTATAVAVKRALQKVCGISVQIKWVNDLFYQQKKICGILCEGIVNPASLQIDAIVFGIGINVSTQNYPENLQEAGALTQTEQFDRNSIIAEVLSQLFLLLEQTETADILKDYRQSSCILGKTIYITQGNKTYRAQALDINEQAALIVQDEHGERLTLSSGEISIRLVN